VHRDEGRSHSPGIASLANLGNTCFLNSVLYTLRFTPGFCHSLHHLHHDLADTKPDRDSEQECLLDMIQTLHHLFQKLCSSDCEGGSEPREPVLPSALLHSIGRLCPLFEGNQQQDAHELLVTLLTSLQDVQLPEVTPPPPSLPQPPDSHDSVSAKKTTKKKEAESSQQQQQQPQNGLSKLSLSDETVNFVKDNFVGLGVMRTKCLECEASTYTKETFTNIDIPILGSSQQEGEEDESSPSLFTSQILSSEILRSDNKYWCSECRRLNEAQRSVSYDVLPTVLILQLKRFTTVASKTYVSKLTDFIPTPFTLDCFCSECSSPNVSSGARHKYRLYSVILHLGASLASGHYIAYVRAADTSLDYFQCKRPGSADTIKTSKKRGLFKMFSKSSSVPVEAKTSLPSPVCPSLACCGLKVTAGSNGCQTQGSGPGEQGGRSTQGGDQGRSSPAVEQSQQSGAEEVWLECDDEQISVITRRELSDILTTRQSTTTPYLLFYSRI